PGAGSGKSVTRGVSVEVGEVQTAIDLELVVDYGVSITDVAGAVRENVISAVERMAGREVVEVNIMVGDVKLPDEEDEEDEGQERQRLQ
ncbi:Asp23/Gls24 family envelope stress response protein, partial [Streptomyces zaomyceticus]